MVIGKIKPTATIVAQFAAGVEVDAIQHDGKMFLPIVGMGEFATKDDAPSPKKTEPTPDATETPVEKTAKSAKESADKKYTEDELMEMSTKDLLKMCKSMGIDPDATGGKNTNKKLRTLILEAQEGTSATDKDDEDDEEDDDNTDNNLAVKVSEILEDFDGGKKNKKKTIAAICSLVDDADKDAVAELVEKFEDDADADIDKIAEEIAKALGGSTDEDEDDDEDDEEEEETPKSKKSKKFKKDEDLVDVKDLKVGDRVSVWWDDDNQEWYDGEVKSISKKGKVVIAYDDDTEDAIDPEVHTKIKRLED